MNLTNSSNLPQVPMVGNNNNLNNNNNIIHTHVTQPIPDRYNGARNLSGQPHGQGTLIRIRNDATITFEGQWIEGDLPNGTSRCITNNIIVYVYQGPLKNLQAEGTGMVTLPGGTYTGEFKEGAYHGNGYFLGDCITRRGTWNKGKFIEGTTLNTATPDVTFVLSGTWLDKLATGQAPVLHGQGNMKCVDVNKNLTVTYEGTWVEGRLVHGTKTICKGNETCSYSGAFNEVGDRHGEGTLTRIQGGSTEIFRGTWTNDMITHGTFTNGLQFYYGSFKSVK